jgi:hypothetical protein
MTVQTVEPVALDDLRSFLAAIWQPGDVREVRIPKYSGRRTAAGYFDDPEALAAAVTSWDGRSNLYITLNPVNPALIARAANRIDTGADELTGDDHIVERRWLYVDIDPKRPAGISANDAENLAALEVARSTWRYLGEQGWPAPLVAMTGNGYELLYPVALPNDAASTALAQGILKHLAERFDTDEVSIDLSVFNAARITGLIGTMKVKGDATADRPHRRSGIVSMPDEFATVPREQLAALVPATNGHKPAMVIADDRMPAGWVKEWLDRAGVTYHHEQLRKGTTWYQLDDCPFHPGEGAGDCGVGEAADGKGAGHCLHNRGVGKTWHDFREALGLTPPAPLFTINTSPVVEPLAAEPDDDPWPAPPAEAAYHGVLGDIARTVAPRTEADPVNLLGTLLVMFGAACGDGRALYQGSMQRTNLSLLLVGETGFRGRKGTGLDVGRSVFRLAYPELDSIWLVGAASGEAITGHLGRHPDEERVLIVEPEFGRLLTIMNREGSTLSAVLRNAWDGVPLGHARARDESLISRHHVSMLGHITPIELRSKLTDADAANGFANRILFLAVRRTHLIPFPESPDALVADYIEPLHRAIVEARVFGPMYFDDEARDRWEWFYAELAATPRLGLAGAVTGRHEAQVARLALVYAVADRSPAIGVAHLEAAIALADYARRSAAWALGDSTGNRHADVLRRMLVDGELTYEEARRSTGLRTAADLDQAVAVLVDAGFAEIARVRRDGAAGRPRRVLRSVGANHANPANSVGVAHTEEQGITT